jgi:hypothetical protein
MAIEDTGSNVHPVKICDQEIGGGRLPGPAWARTADPPAVMISTVG